ncbi:MAG: patatin-like phospholipase family protein [Gammaproteobacteria bacterium]|nr:patatin-like phospholipase family protein [Gammaproteobacteria bacterium]
MTEFKGNQQQLPKTGLILAGGGARAAYQVGVLKAIARMRAPETRNPFPILCGSSAGAINATALSIYSQDFQDAVTRLVWVWSNFTIEQVIRSDALGLAKSGAHWLLALMLGGLGQNNPAALFNRQPLRHLLQRYMPCDLIKNAIEAGTIDALSITASGYTSGQSVTFYQSKHEIKPWSRVVRVGCPTEITIDHLMASSAIPFIFEAVRLNREYFGDGSMRQLAPISPALHLGAERVLVVGVRSENDNEFMRRKTTTYPSVARIAGHVLNSIFLDSMEMDLERLQRINRTLSLIPKHYFDNGTVELRPVKALVVSPSRDISKIARDHAYRLPRTLRFFLGGVGAMDRDGNSLLSYLLFDKAYCRDLIALGFNDTIKRRDEIMAFLDGNDDA